jgi:hypothetical protein
MVCFGFALFTNDYIRFFGRVYVASRCRPVAYGSDNCVLLATKYPTLARGEEPV